MKFSINKTFKNCSPNFKKYQRLGVFIIKLFTFEDASGISYAGNNNICLVIDRRNSSEAIHLHDYYELIYIYSGSIQQTVNDNKYLTKHGYFTLVEPGSTHSYSHIEHSELINICFTEYSDTLDSALSNYFNQTTALKDSDIPLVEGLIHSLESELKQADNYSTYNATNCLNWLLTIFIRNASNINDSNNQWGVLHSYIMNNYSTVTLEEAAKLMNLSKSYFCRVFKNTFSTSFYKYLTNIRIQRAKSLLSDSQMSIAEIAEKVGYVNGYCHFFETFKKQVGMTPLEFRKNWKEVKREAENQTYIMYPKKKEQNEVSDNNE